ncbi:diguanylate cyclase, partial [Rhizobium sp. Rhizsp42]
MPDSGFFYVDLPENVLYADNALATLFGVDPAEAEQGLPIEVRAGSVCLNRLGRFAKWISASIMPPLS